MSDKRQQPELRYDVAHALYLGERELQEDALATDFPHAGRLSFAVLADGMGGHAAGEVASKIVVTEVFSELKFQSGELDDLGVNLAQIMRDAALGANNCIRAHTAENRDTRGMGATLLAPIFLDDHLYWISIGDSPLYLVRDGNITQLNEDHSLAPQIDFMVQAGLIAEDVGRDHPDRNCLTSVIGGETIDKVDCRSAPFELSDGDVIIAASDGLQTLSDAQICDVILRDEPSNSHMVVERLLKQIEGAKNPIQDNVSLCVIKISSLTRQRKSKPKLQTGRRKSAEVVPIRSKSAALGSNSGNPKHSKAEQ